MTSIIKVDTLQKANGGTPTAADLGINTTGNVLQVVHNQSTAAYTSGGGDTSFSNVLAKSITPTSTSSKIKITVCGVYYVNNTASYINHRFRIVRDGVALSDYNGSAAFAHSTTSSTITVLEIAG